MLVATCALVLVACSGERPDVPSNVVVADRVPSGFATPRATASDVEPAIVAARFSTLDVALGELWHGEVVTSTNVRNVALRTNLFDVAASRVAPGRFRFLVRVYDLPSFLVRPYVLHLVASTAAGGEASLAVPFRIAGRVAQGR